MVNGLEAVADGIQQFEGWFTHDHGVSSMSYRNRNPGNLETAGQKNVYPDFVTGYSALLRELQAKFSGNNAHGIGPESTMLQLFNIYAPPSDNNPTNAYCAFVCSWATMVLGKSVTPDTLLQDIWRVPSD